MTNLQSFETALVGQWIRADGKTVADTISKRIETLIISELSRMGASADGWDVLYQDQNDGRFWELTYPHKEWHGGGPPSLTNIPIDFARNKYGLQL